MVLGTGNDGYQNNQGDTDRSFWVTLDLLGT
jgi:hypothetical protein